MAYLKILTRGQINRMTISELQEYAKKIKITRTLLPQTQQSTRVILTEKILTYFRNLYNRAQLFCEYKEMPRKFVTIKKKKNVSDSK